MTSCGNRRNLLGGSYDAIIALLNGLIQKIDTLDTDKFSYDEAWKMVDIQINRKLEILNSLKENKAEELTREPPSD